MFSEEDCWEFLADCMAPFTSVCKSGALAAEGCGLEESSHEKVQRFLRDLGENAAVEAIAKHKVSIIIPWHSSE